jgi:LEM3 (ligand-effect modulator 3) family / CDC50 family
MKKITNERTNKHLKEKKILINFLFSKKNNNKMQLSEQEDLIVWMRPAALPKFRKLYGVIEVDLDANNVVSIHIANNYNSYSFGGAKKVIMTTSKWLGAGRNSFLGFAYLVTGTLSLLLSILFALIHVRNPRYFSIL